MSNADLDNKNERDYVQELARLFLGPPEPKDATGPGALEALIEIGFYCGMGFPLNESQRHFMSNFSTKMRNGLNKSDASATKVLVEALGLNKRDKGGGPAHQYRLLNRNREAARRVLEALADNPAIFASDAISKVADEMGLHYDTVDGAAQGSDYRASINARRRKRGAPRKAR